MNNIRLTPAVCQELWINEEGQVFVSDRGLAYLCDVREKVIRDGADRRTIGISRFIASKGFEDAELVTEDGIPDEIATLFVEYYAFEAGRYCTKQAKEVYRAFAAIGFRAWIQKELGWSPTTSVSQTVLVEAVIKAIDLAFKDLDIDQTLVAECKLNAAAKILPPEANMALEESRKLLVPTTTTTTTTPTPTPQRLLTATELGKELGGLSAQQVNKLLIEKGLQVKTVTGSLTYFPTKRGQQFSNFTFPTGKGNTRFPRLKWCPSVALVL